MYSFFQTGQDPECKNEQGDSGSNSHITHRQIEKTDNYTPNFTKVGYMKRRS